MNLNDFLNANYDNCIDILKSPPYNLRIGNDGNFWVFNYNQIESDMSIQICQDARGIIFYKDANEFNLVCNPFKKFFNIGEKNAFNIDLSRSIKILEKVDGSILKCYFNGTEWIIATNATINSKNAMTRIDGKSFYDIFTDVVDERTFEIMKSCMDANKTYLFELIHPITRIIVDYGELKELVYLGFRYNDSYLIENDYLPDNTFDSIKCIRRPNMYDIQYDNLERLQLIADEYNTTGTHFEGFVVVNISENKVVGRIKIKSPKYLKFHRLAGGSIYNSIMKIILDNETEELEAYLSKLPYYVTEIFTETKSKYDEFICNVSLYIHNYKMMSTDNSRKDVAIHIKNNVISKFQPFIFSSVYSNIDPIHVLRNKPLRDVRKLIGMSDVEIIEI